MLCVPGRWDGNSDVHTNNFPSTNFPCTICPFRSTDASYYQGIIKDTFKYLHLEQ